METEKKALVIKESMMMVIEHYLGKVPAGTSNEEIMAAFAANIEKMVVESAKVYDMVVSK